MVPAIDLFQKWTFNSLISIRLAVSYVKHIGTSNYMKH